MACSIRQHEAMGGADAAVVGMLSIHDIYRPLLRYFRTRRMRQFVELFGVTDQTRIIDDRRHLLKRIARLGKPLQMLRKIEKSKLFHGASPTEPSNRRLAPTAK